MKNTSSYLSLLFLFAITITISSCSMNKDKVDPLDVIASESCSDPCWRGITPGDTTFNEAWTLVQQMKQASNTNEIVPTAIKKDAANRYIIIYFEKISVTFNNGPHGVIENGELYFYLLHRRDKPKLVDLLSVYGEPDSIEICHDLMERRRAIVYIYYPQMYLMFDKILPIHGDSFEVPIEKDTRIDYITLLPQSYERPVYDFSFSWTGYGDVIIEPEKQSLESICKILFP